MTDYIKIRKRLEELSSAYKQLCEKGITSPETCALGIHKYNPFCIAVGESYKIFCEELKLISLH